MYKVNLTLGSSAREFLKTFEQTGPDSVNMRSFSTGATRDTDEGKLHFKGFLSPVVMKRFAEYMESHRVQPNGSVRDPDNWKKGIPLSAYEDSFIRHVFEWWELIEEGKRDEAKKIAPAIFFNIQGWMHEMETER